MTKTLWDGAQHENAHVDLVTGQKYRYRVRAQLPSGEMVDSAESAVYLLAPPTVTAQESGHDAVVLAWSDVSAAEGYNVYCATAPEGVPSLLAAVAGTGYTDDVDGGAPAQVTGLYGSTHSSWTVTLSWMPVSVPDPGAVRYYSVVGVAEGQEGIRSSTYSCSVNPEITGYRIYRDGAYLTTVSSGTSIYTDRGLNASTLYLYMVSAISSDELEGQKSAMVSVTTFPSSIPAPEDVMGIRVLSEDGNAVRVGFQPVRHRVDGSSIEGYLSGYTVYRSNSLDGPWEAIRNIEEDDTCEFTDTHSGQLRYYRVSAGDIYDQEGDTLMTVTTSLQVYIHSKDRKMSLMFDDAAREAYLYEGVGKRIRIVKDEQAAEDSAASYTITAYDPDGNPIEGGLIVGSRRGAQLVFQYGTGNGASRAGATGNLQPTLYWHNTLKWVKVNGEYNSETESIALRTKTLGRYAIRLAERSGTFKIINVEPKIFSPDETNPLIGWARICFENPKGSEVTSAIYDLRGNLVRKNLPRELETVLYWDGRDSGGSIVPSGVYVYQLEVDNTTLNGTIVVAK
jgi:hypothetical protein